MAFLIVTATVVVLVSGSGLWYLFRRRAPRLKDLSSIDGISTILASRPELSLQVVDQLEEKDKIDFLDAFLAGPDFRWLTVGGDGRQEITDEATKKVHRDVTHYMIKTCICFAERYGHVIECRDRSTHEFLGALHIIPPYSSFKIYNIHFYRSVIGLGDPVPKRHGKAMSARFEYFLENTKYHEELMKGRPHCYIGALGVVTTFQGRGGGRMLMDTAKALAGSLPIYLECNDDNVPFYEKCGLRVQKRVMMRPKIPESDNNNADEVATAFPFSYMIYEP